MISDCKAEKCNKRAYYGYTYKVYLSCSDHRLNDMINVKNKHYQKFLHIENAFKSVTENHIKAFFGGSFKATKQLE